jgi:pimeloyl-ACP methyl ester carboxylesterase
VTEYLRSADGTRIAFDATGSGPAIILLHGGGRTRQAWHETGYVARLADEFAVITIDLRGNGDSDHPTTIEAYAFERMTEDVVAVADAAGAEQFTLWGFSYGANIGRYLAARSDRVQAMVYIGIPFGAAASGAFRQAIVELQAKEPPALEPDRVRVAAASAMLDYPDVEPEDLRCPTLWVVGTANEPAMASVSAYRDRLAGTQVSLALFDGLTHREELTQIDIVLPIMVKFTRARVDSGKG